MSARSQTTMHKLICLRRLIFINFIFCFSLSYFYLFTFYSCCCYYFSQCLDLCSCFICMYIYVALYVCGMRVTINFSICLTASCLRFALFLFSYALSLSFHTYIFRIFTFQYISNAFMPLLLLYIFIIFNYFFIFSYAFFFVAPLSPLFWFPVFCFVCFICFICFLVPFSQFGSFVHWALPLHFDTL